MKIMINYTKMKNKWKNKNNSLSSPPVMKNVTLNEDFFLPNDHSESSEPMRKSQSISLSNSNNPDTMM